MKRLFAAAVFTLLGASLAVAAPLDAFNNQKGSLDIAGGTAHIPVMKLAAQAIMERYPDIRITVAGGGSGVGVQKVGEGLVQIGNTGRALRIRKLPSTAWSPSPSPSTAWPWRSTPPTA